MNATGNNRLSSIDVHSENYDVDRNGSVGTRETENVLVLSTSTVCKLMSRRAAYLQSKITVSQSCMSALFVITCFCNLSMFLPSIVA